ncbi:MAG TPA: ABC transporter permease [Candidatus Dormibacteraeota bacterium]|nr:ABC transporter permease [Candidatus Dormibacteraeota bacterium]
MRNLRPWFWIEAASAILTLLMLILTLAVRDWFETAFQIDPDQKRGSFEWLLVVVSALVTTGLVALARHEWRRAKLLRG